MSVLAASVITLPVLLVDLEVATLDFPEGSAVPLAELRADSQLKMPDCYVLLGALDQQARVASFDDRLIKRHKLEDWTSPAADAR